MRLIDADALIAYCYEEWIPLNVDAVNEQSTIEERKTGEWIDSGIRSRAFDIFGVRTWASRMICNQCGFVTHAIEGHMEQYNFCPNCGADMRRENNG